MGYQRAHPKGPDFHKQCRLVQIDGCFTVTLGEGFQVQINGVMILRCHELSTGLHPSCSVHGVLLKKLVDPNDQNMATKQQKHICWLIIWYL